MVNRKKSMKLFFVFIFLMMVMGSEAQFAPPLVRNPLTTNSLVVPSGTVSVTVGPPGTVTISGTQTRIFSGNGIQSVSTNNISQNTLDYSLSMSNPIVAQIMVWTDFAANLNTNIIGQGILSYAKDLPQLRIGDGSTLGGVNVGGRFWATRTNAMLAEGRSGELAISGGYKSATAGAGFVPPTLWMNSASGTNWSPMFSVDATNNYNVTAPALGYNWPLPETFQSAYAFDQGRNGTNADLVGFTGISSFLPVYGLKIKAGSGGNSATGGFGGNGGNLNGYLIAAGNGGNALVSGAIGGLGGDSGVMTYFGGKGGDSGFNGFSGGNGGLASAFNFSGGNGANATASSNGGGGGNAGSIILNGANAAGSISGGNGGGINTGASGTNSGGNIFSGATVFRKGGTIYSYSDTYISSIVFTTTSTSGPTNTVSETTLLGTGRDANGPSQKKIWHHTVDNPGRTMRFSLSGYMFDSLSPTLQIRIKIGASTVIDTTPLSLSTITGPQPWSMAGQITFRTVGTNGTAIGTALLTYNSSAGTPQMIGISPPLPTTVDTTVDNVVDATAQFSAASQNSLQCTTAVFDLVN